jgi:hypothetical protein
MPLQNRVTPFGEIVATPERGTLYGNRGGRFHDPATKRLVGRRRHVSRRWICCELEFKGRHHEVFGPRYTGLFFLDEATALAAGHRPCFECRHADALHFRDAFARGNGLAAPSADEMDVILHAERMSRRPAITDWRELPSGAMLAVGGEAHLVAPGRLLRWTPGGYAAPGRPSGPAILLTPPSIVATLRAGFAPRLHPSATALTAGRAASRAR